MSAGFTLVELLIATSISVITMAMVAVLSVHQIRITDTISTTATLDRRFRTLSNLLREEFREACLLRADANPRTTATAPDTPCNPEPVSPCGNLTTGVSTPASGNDVRLLMPIRSAVATDPPDYRVVRFYRTGTDLLRDGPTITINGTLDSTANTNGQLVASNVSAFTTTVSPDCSWARLNITMSVPGTATTQTRILTLYSGADLSIT
jgi:prepilin-type N-terminal cleavage/methylation domain-containing protein